MLQVDDLIEPGAEQILLTRLTPFRGCIWSLAKACNAE